MALTDKAQLIRPADALTNEYVESTAVQVGNSSRVNLGFDFTLASLTSMEAVVEVGDGTAWRRYCSIAVNNGTITVYPATFTFLPADHGTTATSAVLSLELADAKVRVKAKGTGTVAGSSLAVTASEGNDD